MKSLRTLASKTLTPSLLRYVTTRLLSTQYVNPELDSPPSSAYYDELIAAAGRRRDFAAVRRHLNKRMKDGFFNTAKTFKFVASDPSVLDELTLTLAQLDDGFARKSSYDALIICLCKIHRTADALRLIEEMILRNYGANAITFHPILNAFTKKKQMDEAWRVVDFMRENKIPLDLMAYNYLLTAYCYVGDLTSATGMLTRMAEEGLGADTRTYDALVLGACKAGKVEGAMVVLRRMEDDGVPVQYSTHVHVINALLKLGYYEEAVEFVMSYGGRERGLDRENFGILANRLIEMKRVDEAKVVVKEMIRRGLKMESSKLKTFYELHMEE